MPGKYHVREKPPLSLRFLPAIIGEMGMDPIIAQCRDEEIAGFLWHAISRIQAMTDRMLAQCKSSLGGEGGDPYALPGLSGT